MRKLVFLVALSRCCLVDGFQAITIDLKRVKGRSSSRFTPLASLNKSQQTEAATLSPPATATLSETEVPIENDQASKWKAEAERIRREAEQLDTALTLQKIEALERKLANQSWLDKHPEEVDTLQQQLGHLKRKLAGEEPIAATKPSAVTSVDEQKIIAN